MNESRKIYEKRDIGDVYVSYDGGYVCVINIGMDKEKGHYHTTASVKDLVLELKRSKRALSECHMSIEFAKMESIRMKREIAHLRSGEFVRRALSDRDRAIDERRKIENKIYSIMDMLEEDQ